MRKILCMLGGVVAVAVSASAAQAGGNFGISINSGGYYAPAPVYYAPQPVYYAPRPVYQPYYPHYSPAYRINYWNGPNWHRGHGYGHGRRWQGRGHGHGHGHGRGHGWR